MRRGWRPASPEAEEEGAAARLAGCRRGGVSGRRQRRRGRWPASLEVEEKGVAARLAGCRREDGAARGRGGRDGGPPRQR
jgi:hypothetical protein